LRVIEVPLTIAGTAISQFDEATAESVERLGLTQSIMCPIGSRSDYDINNIWRTISDNGINGISDYPAAYISRQINK
jgi:hypothetical protein